MKKTSLFFFYFCIAFVCYGQTSADRSLKVKVTVNTSPLSFTLRWQKGLNAKSYAVLRKNRTDTSWTTLTTGLGINDTFYVDNTVQSGIGYEYNVNATSDIVPFTAYTYLYCADKFPVKHQQGKLILLVDSNYINPLSAEIKRLENDLILEGWFIIRKNIGRTQTVKSVKQFIVSTYLSDTANVKGIFILGHIPVPYSGLIFPDGHDDHYGAWPTDSYYCDTSFNYWTDLTVNNTTAARPETKNIPGDGKFDPSFINRNHHKLFSGRVDLFDIPVINKNDTALTKQYLDKDHQYRIAGKKFRMRGLIEDNFGYMLGEAFASNGWRNFSTLLLPDSVSAGDYSSMINNNSYLWSYGCGAGGYEGAGGIANSSTYASTEFQTVFTMQFGSYFGDWNIKNSYLRAPLASKSATLINCWAGRPNWYFHHMAMGEPIGLDAYESCVNKNTYQPPRHGMQMIHQTLMGDPTLRMYVYEPPTNLIIKDTNSTTTARLSWNPSTSVGVLGYYVYRSKSLTDTFTLLNPNYITATSYNDHNATSGKNIYIVKAVKLQNSATGSFYNLSPGVMDSITLSSTTPTAIASFSGVKSPKGNNISWLVNCTSNNTKIELERSANGINFDPIYNLIADSFPCKNTFSYFDSVNLYEVNYYRLKVTDINGTVSYSNNLAFINSGDVQIIFRQPPLSSGKEIDLQIISAEDKIVKISISDMSGRLVKSIDQPIYANANYIKLNCYNLAAGIYIINCIENNKRIYTTRFLLR